MRCSSDGIPLALRRSTRGGGIMRKVLLAITLAGIGYVAVAAQGPSQKEPFGPSLKAVVGLEQVPGRPVRNRELAKVVFPHPVKVLNAWLLGDYLIEHDTDRMERGEPCTHIYRFNDRRKPVVTFFCEHL